MSLSSQQETQQKKDGVNGKWNQKDGESSHRYKPYLVKLAPESPLLKSSDVFHDDNSYDSFHNYETDICRDSSDEYSDGSSQTEGYAVVDVIEYELPDDSESDFDVSSGSSGTDDFTCEAIAQAAFYGFNARMNGNPIDDSEEFFLADTEEESDGSVDLELGQADYWKCVKCNNQQNNPMYRFCERCFQERKSFYPPRPKRQKSRAEHSRKRKMAQLSQDYSTTEVESDSDEEVHAPAMKKAAISPRAEQTIPTCVGSKNGNQLNNNDKLKSENSKHANSAGELSCNNNTSSDDGEDGELTVSSDADRNDQEIVRKIRVSPSSSIEISKVTTLGTRTPSHSDKLAYKIENKIIQNVYRQDVFGLKRPNTLDWKDSGLSSCQDSSQELLSSSPSEEGCLARSSSAGSSRSFDSQSDNAASQASTQVQQDSDDETDSEGILTRVEEFTLLQERQMKTKAELMQSALLNIRLPSFSNSQSQDRPTLSSDSLPEERPPSSDSLPEERPPSDSQPEDVNDSNLGLCRFCMVNPKNGVFVHNNCLHLCCCYKCAVKVWKKRKSCPICNCKIKNVTKLFVH